MVLKGEQIMNLGFFVPTSAGTPQNTKIYNFLNNSVEDLTSASVFFDDTGFNPVAPRFGMFDSADMWSFSGNLICTTIDNLKRAVSTVNNIKLAYLFSSSEDVERNLFDFVGIAQTYKVLVDNLVDYNTFYRLTGHKPVLVEDWSVDKLKEIFNG
jgi:hypothetical protein